MNFFGKIALISALVFSGYSSAGGPHEKILKAKESFVKTTQLGRLHAGFYENDHGSDLILFDIVSTEYQTKKRRGKNVLRMNWALRSATHEYLSWVLFQGLVYYDLDKKLGGVKLPMLIEMDYYIFTKSMQYLDQSGMLITDEIDYANHPTYNFGRNRLLSITLFYELWTEDEREFLKAVWVRRQKLDKEVLSVIDYLQRTDLSTAQRDAANKLKTLWYQR